MSACMSEFKKMFKFTTNLNHKVVSSSTMDIYGFSPSLFFSFLKNHQIKLLINTP